MAEKIEESPLVHHARVELERAGLFDPDSDYGGMLGNAVMELVQVLAKQGHSGMSAGMALSLFDVVARWKTLTPITSAPSEWQDMSDFPGEPMWQNRRRPDAFSRDGGKTWYTLDPD